MKRTILSLLVALIGVTGAWALDNVSYIDATGNLQSANNVTEITNTAGTLNAGWYVVTGENVQTAGLVCNGDVHLILADGAKLTATGAESESGIQVTGDNNSLTIYGQQNQIGQLIANGGEYAAGIGGGDVGSGSNITFNGGTVTATGGRAGSGIGGGDRGTASNITFNGGTVTATGGPGGAGIGGGVDGSASNITFNGGTVTATGGQAGSGIGGGNYGSASNITFNGGTVTTTGGEWASGIGSTYSLTINGGVITANGGVIPDSYEGVRASCIGEVTSLYVADSLMLRADNNNPPTTVINRSDPSYISQLTEAQYAIIEPYLHVPYVDAKGNPQTAKYVAEMTNNLTTLNAGWYVVLGSDVQTAGLTCNGAVHLILADDAKLTATGDEWQAAGIQVGENSSLTIYGQTHQSGQLFANGGGWEAAGIGGSASAITINGGHVTATGGYDGDGAVGIGGSASNITINSGHVTATGGDHAVGIGGSAFNITINGGHVTAAGGDGATGIDGSASNIYVAESMLLIADNNNPPTTVINRSDPSYISQLTSAQYATLEPYIQNVPYIDAEGNPQTAKSVAEMTNNLTTMAAGWYVVLGSDVQTAGLICNGAVHLILADGAKLTATGGDRHPGIQVMGENNSLTIYGQTNQSGQLFANGGGAGAGIGGDDYLYNGSNITINGGNITANGGEWGAGIGGGHGGSVSNIIIHGGVIAANGGDEATGIGKGMDGWTATNIIVDTDLLIKADDNNPPTTEIDNDGSDLGERLDNRRYVIISELPRDKAAAIAEIRAAVEGITDPDILAIADNAIADINAAATVESVNSIKSQAFADINAAILSPIKTAAIAEIDAVVEGITNPDILAIANQAIADINDATTVESVDSIKSQALVDLEYVVGIYRSGQADAYSAPTQPGMRMVVTKKAEGTNPAKVYEFDTRDIESVAYREVTE